jgi:SAM-dependent methyltransferase
MHAEALAYVNRWASDAELRVVEFGARDINGSPRSLFPKATWWGIDIVDGPAVDEIADGATWVGDTPADMVVCCEVFEHCPTWEQLVAGMAANLRPGGRAVITAAGPQRAPHSAVDGGGLRDGEHYANVDPETLRIVLKGAGFTKIEVEELGGDVYASAVLADKKGVK